MKAQLQVPQRPFRLLLLILAGLAVTGRVALAQTWQYGGVNNLWSNGANWSGGGAPGPGGNVVIPTGGGPLLDVSASIGSLTLQGSASVEEKGEDNIPHNLTVSGTTTIQNLTRQGGYLEVGTGSIFSLGTLANFSGGVLTGGDFAIVDYDSLTNRAPTVLQFRGANVIENRAEVFMEGADARMLDQDSGLDAFRNLAINSGFFYVEDVPPMSTTGNLTNNDTFYIFDSIDAPATTFTINGSVTNTRDGDFEAYGNAQIIVKGDLVNRGAAPGGEIYLFNKPGVPPGDCVLSVDGDLFNETEAKITMDGAGGRNSRLIVKGNMTNDGSIDLYGTGSMEVGGVLTLASGSLTLIGDSGIETFMMTAKRIDAAAGTEFGARGTIFADLTEHGVFYPGASPGQVTIKGNIAFGNTAQLRIELGGTAAGAQYDQIVQQSTGTGGVTLGGKLDIAFVNGFESTLQNSDTFTILTSDLALNGAFSNVANGGRLHTSNGSSSFVVTYNGNSVVLSGAQLEPLTLTGAVSQKFHGNDPYDIPLPLAGTAGVECRRGPTAEAHDLLFTFSNAVVSGNAAVTAGTGTTSGAVPYQNGLYVPLTAVTNGQTITVTLTNVTDTRGQVLPPTSVSIRVLLGDTNGDGSVNAGDARQTRNRSGQATAATNFRSDVNSDGIINTGDALIVRSRSGTSVAP